jgi:GT2 family glycosyltransferase
MVLKGDPVPDGPTPIDSAWAPVVAARSQVMREVAMPEDYFLYGEELEWFHRLRSAGARVELLPTVRVLHFGGVRVVRPDKSRLQARNSVRAVRRIRGRRAALLVWPRVVAWQLRLLAASVARREGSNAIRSHTVGVGSALMAWREITVPASP